jgi:RNA 2',3'-cyclic 3'-phosphodiesterase
MMVEGGEPRRPKLRLFVAVDPGSEMQERVGRAQGRVRRRAPDAKWVRPESMHVTLAFLGYQDEERVEQLTNALAEVAARHPSMTLSAAGVGTFGSSKRPRVLWTDLTGEVEALGALQRDVERALVPLGYAPENRPFRAHLTLARARDPGGDVALARCASDLKDETFGSSVIAEIVLFRSELSPKGATYTALARLPLRG